MNKIEFIADTIVNTIFEFLPAKKPSDAVLKNVKLIAHRGVHRETTSGRSSDKLGRGFPIENSFEAFSLAVQNKIWAIEFDVHFTKDNIPIISHDPNAGRIFEREDLKFQEHNFLDLKKQIPKLISLEDVILHFSKKIHLMIEIKENLSTRPAAIQNLKICLQTLEPVIDYHLLTLDPTFLEPMSFAPKTAYMDVIWLNSKKIKNLNKSLNHGALGGHFLNFSDDEIAQFHKDNRKVGVGFICSKNSMYREINRGADFIFTNMPLTLQKFL
jgi:glycerophosphoryl diester phosphodiesterase